jgi:hypothetical protein
MFPTQILTLNQPELASVAVMLVDLNSARVLLDSWKVRRQTCHGPLKQIPGSSSTKTMTPSLQILSCLTFINHHTAQSRYWCKITTKSNVLTEVFCVQHDEIWCTAYTFRLSYWASLQLRFICRTSLTGQHNIAETNSVSKCYKCACTLPDVGQACMVAAY